ncbi:hypothetical protein KKC91_06875, partial [bacterium]|nr:hypothetical protein [bacterium]
MAISFSMHRWSILPRDISRLDYYRLSEPQDDYSLKLRKGLIHQVRKRAERIAREKERAIEEKKGRNITRSMDRIFSIADMPQSLREAFIFDILGKGIAVSPLQRSKERYNSAVFSEDVIVPEGITYYSFFRDELFRIKDKKVRLLCAFKLAALGNYFGRSETETFGRFTQLVKNQGLEWALENPIIREYFSETLEDSNQFVEDLLRAQDISDKKKRVLLSVNDSGWEAATHMLLTEALVDSGFLVTIVANHRPIGHDLDVRDVKDIFGYIGDLRTSAVDEAVVSGESLTVEDTVRNDDSEPRQLFLQLRDGDTVLAQTEDILIEPNQEHAFRLTWTPTKDKYENLQLVVCRVVDRDANEKMREIYGRERLVSSRLYQYKGKEVTIISNGSRTRGVDPTNVSESLHEFILTENPEEEVVAWVLTGGANLSNIFPVQRFIRIPLLYLANSGGRVQAVLGRLVDTEKEKALIWYHSSRKPQTPAHFSLCSKSNSLTKEGTPTTDRFSVAEKVYDVTDIEAIESELQELATVTPKHPSINVTFTIRGPTEREKLLSFLHDNPQILINALDRSKALHDGELSQNMTIVLADRYDYLAGDHKDNNLIILNASDLEAMIAEGEDSAHISELVTSLLSEELAHERGAEGDIATEQALAQGCADNTITSLGFVLFQDYIAFVERYGTELDEENGYLGYLKGSDRLAEAEHTLTAASPVLFRRGGLEPRIADTVTSISKVEIISSINEFLGVDLTLDDLDWVLERSGFTSYTQLYRTIMDNVWFCQAVAANGMLSYMPEEAVIFRKMSNLKIDDIKNLLLNGLELSRSIPGGGEGIPFSPYRWVFEDSAYNDRGCTIIVTSRVYDTYMQQGKAGFFIFEEEEIRFVTDIPPEDVDTIFISESMYSQDPEFFSKFLEQGRLRVVKGEGEEIGQAFKAALREYPIAAQGEIKRASLLWNLAQICKDREGFLENVKEFKTAICRDRKKSGDFVRALLIEEDIRSQLARPATDIPKVIREQLPRVTDLLQWVGTDKLIVHFHPHRETNPLVLEITGELEDMQTKILLESVAMAGIPVKVGEYELYNITTDSFPVATYAAQTQDGLSVVLSISSPENGPAIVRRYEEAKKAKTYLLKPFHYDTGSKLLFFEPFGETTLYRLVIENNLSQQELLLILLEAAKGIQAFHRDGLERVSLDSKYVLVESSVSGNIAVRLPGFLSFHPLDDVRELGRLLFFVVYGNVYGENTYWMGPMDAKAEIERSIHLGDPVQAGLNVLIQNSGAISPDGPAKYSIDGFVEELEKIIRALNQVTPHVSTKFHISPSVSSDQISASELSLINVALFNGEAVLEDRDRFLEVCSDLVDIDPSIVAVIIAGTEAEAQALRA